MAYADSLMATGERIVLRERQHWFVLVYEARWALLGLLLGFALLLLRGGGATPGGLFGDVLLWVTLLLLVGGGIWAAWSVLRWQSEEYVVTTRRILACEGVINRRATDSSLEKINDAILTQSLFGRIFGFGDLEVLTASEAGIERLRMLPDAPGFKRAMLDAKYAIERELAQPSPPDAVPAPGSGAPPPVSTPAGAAPGTGSVPAASATAASRPMTSDEVTTTLARLADLRDRGAITAEDYEAKKRDLLSRL
ncbi:MAG: PH domain-containing protein [Syntrophomonadaceae bacterium]